MEWNLQQIALKQSNQTEFSFQNSFGFFFFRRELEQRLRELKRRKKEKKEVKRKEFEEEREKDKKRWTDFNTKVKMKIFTLYILFAFFSWKIERGKALFQNRWSKPINERNNYTERQMDLPYRIIVQHNHDLRGKRNTSRWFLFV